MAGPYQRHFHRQDCPSSKCHSHYHILPFESSYDECVMLKVYLLPKHHPINLDQDVPKDLLHRGKLSRLLWIQNNAVRWTRMATLDIVELFLRICYTWHFPPVTDSKASFSHRAYITLLTSRCKQSWLNFRCIYILWIPRVMYIIIILCSVVLICALVCTCQILTRRSRAHRDGSTTKRLRCIPRTTPFPGRTVPSLFSCKSSSSGSSSDTMVTMSM